MERNNGIGASSVVSRAAFIAVIGIAVGASCGKEPDRGVERTIRALTGPSSFVIPLPPKVGVSTLALVANDSLLVDDRATVTTTAGGFAAVANMGINQTNLGVTAKVGDIWSVGTVVLRDRSAVSGFIRTQSATVTRGSNTTVSGPIVGGRATAVESPAGFLVDHPLKLGRTRELTS